jgi:Fe-S cluster biosynthesis and repair protein YggX
VGFSQVTEFRKSAWSGWSRRTLLIIFNSSLKLMECESNAGGIHLK